LECGYKPLEKEGLSSDYVCFNFSMRRELGIGLNGAPEEKWGRRIWDSKYYSSNLIGY
jgi:hypothetical protein